MTPAPIVLFVYNRLWHTRQTVEALQRNDLAEQSELFIYSDGPKNEEAVRNVQEIREYLQTIDGFRKITIVNRENNRGLAANIIDGVGRIVEEYGRVIVLEDDLVTSPHFLTFMNEALDRYKDEKKVWHISGWNYPIETEGLDDAFFWRTMNCWGWATWSDRWQYFEKNVEKTVQEFGKKEIKRFNLDGTENFWAQVLANREGKIDTWAIFWYVTVFRHNGLCLNPALTFVKNIGLDGSGIHCGKNRTFGEGLSFKAHLHFSNPTAENRVAVKRIKRFIRQQRMPLHIRIATKFAKVFAKRKPVR